MSTKQVGSTGLKNISVLLIVFKLLLLTSSSSIGQSVILLDSSQSTRAITDLEHGDKCKEEKQLLLQEIEVLEQARDVLFQQTVVKDSVISMYMRIDTAYQEMSNALVEMTDQHKKELKREKRKKIPWIAVTTGTVVYIIVNALK